MIHLSSRIGGGDHARQVYRPGRRISYIAPAKRVTANHPLRMVRDLVRDVLSDLNRSRGKLYASEGRSFDPCGAIAERCCCRCSTASARNETNCRSNCTTIFYTAGSWGVAGRSGLGPDDLQEERERPQNGNVFTSS